MNQKSKKFFLIFALIFFSLITLTWLGAPKKLLAKLYLKGTPAQPAQITYGTDQISFDSDGDGTPDTVITTAGNVGIGTTTPAGLLDIGGGDLVVLSNSNVGIGTSSPGSKLDVSGDTRFQCRSGYWTIADGRICMESTLRGVGTMSSAMAACKGVAPGGYVCKHTDFQAACGAGISNPYGSTTGWYGDHGTAVSGDWDDEYGTWNGNGCSDNNDGACQVQSAVSLNYRCCY